MADRQSFWRQSLILLARCVSAINLGCVSAHAAILDKVLVSGTDVKATPEEISWIASLIAIGGFISICIDTFLWEYYGRKVVHIYVNTASFVSWIIFYFAGSVNTLIVAKIVEGLALGSFYSMPMIIMGEYVSPCRRGYFLVICEIVLVLSVLLIHMSSLICNRQHIALFGAATSATASFLTCFWPESPYFLALKGRFEECKKSYVWLHGDMAHNNRELQEMIMKQSKNQTQSIKLKDRITVKYVKLHLTRDFIRALFIVILLITVIDASGRLFLMIYCYRIMGQMVNSEAVAVYCAVAINVLQITSYLITIVIIRYYNRRTILFAFGIASTLCMYIVGLAFFLKPLIASETTFSVATMICILIQSFFLNVGVAPVASTIISEVFPMKSKSLGAFLSGIVFTTFLFVFVKFCPTLIEHAGVGGLYVISATISTVCFAFLFKILPETKDKALLEIECEMLNVNSTKTKATTELRPMLE